MIQPDTTKMKKIKELIENKSFQRFILIFCFIFSAICFILVISQIYSFSTQTNQLINPPINNPSIKDNYNPTQIQTQPPAKDDFFRGMPKGSPIMLLVFIFGFMVSLFAGLVIFNNLNGKEQRIIKKELLKTKKELKSKVMNKILLPDEKIVVELLKESSGTLTQSELVKKSGLNKLKVSRVIKKLESLHFIEKYPYGMTNKIRIRG